jgi:hypothetical protein
MTFQMLDFDNQVYPAVFKTTFVDVLILLAANFKIKSSAKYRESINYSQLALDKRGILRMYFVQRMI